jgi:Flp pilus assembly protein TadD
VKRLLAAAILVSIGVAAAYGYSEARRERTFRQLLIQGDAALALDNTFAAVEAFSVAIALDERAMIGYLKRGEVYRRRGESEAALRDLRQASELDPTATRPLEELGDLNLELKRFARASERYRDYVRIDDRAPQVLYKLAYARYSDGHAREAIDPLQKAIALDGRFAEAYYLLGLCQREAQRPAEAQLAFERSIVLQPTLLRAREELADLYGAMGKMDGRLAQLEALAALDPSPPRQVALGLAYARASQVERAVLTLGRAAERHPDDPRAYAALGRVWLDVAEARRDHVAMSKAIGALRDAVANDDSAEALGLLGRATLVLGDSDAAERILQDATRKRPVDPGAFLLLADACERNRHYGEARQALIDYQALHGDEPEARRRASQAMRLAQLSERVGDHAAAAGFFLRAADSNGGDAAMLAQAAEAQWRSGQRVAAGATAQRALEKDPGNAAALAVRKRFDSVKSGAR